MITTTLNRIRAHGPYGIDPRAVPLTGYQKLKAALGPDHGPFAPIPFARIVEINGLDDALLCCRVEPQHAKEWRLFAVWCARQVQHLMKDERSIAAIDVAERHAHRNATDKELAAAQAAAWEAARDTAWDAPWSAADAARAAERAAAWEAARDAAWDAVWIAADGEREAARDAQTKRFLEIVS